MADVRTIQDNLWLHGAYWFPGSDITRDDAGKLELDHKETLNALNRRRQCDANFDILLQAHHGPRRTLQDDNWGPATEHLISLERCPVPDEAPPDNLDYSGLEDWRAELFRSMREWAKSGSGSWPVPGCDPNHRDTHSIRINLDMSGASDGWKRDLSHVIDDCVKLFAEFGLRVTYVLDGDPSECEISKRFERLVGYIGWNEFPRPGTCNQVISGRLASNYDGPSHMKACLEGHETTHGLGGRHTRGGLMNPTILNIDPLTFRGDPHERSMVQWFGGEPLDIDDDPPPPTAAPTLSDITVRHKGQTWVYEAKLKGGDDDYFPPPG